MPYLYKERYMKNFIKALLVILGLILIILSIVSGIFIIIFSYKYMSGTWITFSKYILSAIVLAVSGFLMALAGYMIIYVATWEDKQVDEDGSK
jgi:hypothetical protein